MNKDINTKKPDGIAKAKEEFEQFLKAKKINKQETQPIPDYSAQQDALNATATLHCCTTPGKISVMEFEISGDKALLVRTVPVKNELTGNMNKPDNNAYSFTKKIVYKENDTGCPHCHNPLKFFCDCGAISCHPEQNGLHTCPVCKNTGSTTSFTKPRPIAGSRSANRAEGKYGHGNTKRLPKQGYDLSIPDK